MRHKRHHSPGLSVVGCYIEDLNGNIVILRGVSLTATTYADHNSTHTSIQRIDMATDAASGWYARVIRLPVYPDTIYGQPGWNQGADAYFNDHLKPAIEECIARKVYCIIDWHYISDYDSSVVDTATRNFWSYIAPIYANNPNVILELFNEANKPDDWTIWKAIAQPWVDLICFYTPKNLILVTGPGWSKDMSGGVTNPLQWRQHCLREPHLSEVRRPKLLGHFVGKQLCHGTLLHHRMGLADKAG